MSPLVRKCLAAVGILVLAAPIAAAQESPTKAMRKIDRSLQRSLHDGSKKRVIVSVKAGYRGEISKALVNHGDDVEFESALVDAVTAVVHPEDVMELAQHPWVEAVSADAVVHAAAGKWKRRRVQLAQSWYSSVAMATPLRETMGLAAPNVPTGLGIGVAIIDSGIDPLPDFYISAFYEVNPRGIVRPKVPYDPFGHGTHVAGLIASNGLLSNRAVVGMAPQAHLVGIKVLDGNGNGRTSDVIRALDFVVENRLSLNVKVVNLSLGHPVLAPAKDDPLVRAVERATAAGLVVVIAAGNYGVNADTGLVGYTGVTSPGNAPSAITVGAAITNNSVTRSDDSVARFSSRGPTWFDGFVKPDVIAPGHQLVSNSREGSTLSNTVPDKRRLHGSGTYLELSGTSMAAAVATGLVAVMLDANNDLNPGSVLSPSVGALTPNAVKAILQHTAIPVPDADRLSQGAGEVNGSGAIRLARAVNVNVPTNSWWLAQGVGSPSDEIGGESFAWSGSVEWGGHLYSGDVVYYNAAAWDDNIIWGTEFSDNIIWGTRLDDNIVWGTANVWATNIVWGNRLVGQRLDDNIIWGTSTGDNIVWGTLSFDNIVWGTVVDDNIIWGTWVDDNIIWGTSDDNIIWGTSVGDNVIWGTTLDDNIIWGTTLDDNIIWGTAVLAGEVF